MFDKYYLNHNFIIKDENHKFYYDIIICKQCNRVIIYVYSEYYHFNEEKKFSILKLNCNEYLIKNILE